MQEQIQKKSFQLNASGYQPSPAFRAQTDWREDTFNNPYPEGCNDWIDYEAEKSIILGREGY